MQRPVRPFGCGWRPGEFLNSRQQCDLDAAVAIAFLQKRRKFFARKCAADFRACCLRIGAQIAFKHHAAIAHLISRDRQYGQKSLVKIGQRFRADERFRRKNVRGRPRFFVVSRGAGSRSR